MYRTTLRQLKEHGVDTAWVYNFGYWQDYQAETWQINHNRKHLSDWVIEYIVETAQDLGMNIHYAWQFFCLLYTSPSPRDGLLSRMPSSA